MIRKHYRKVKRAIRKNLNPDPFFLSKYQFSPYMACEHACKYCDGRAEKYHVEDDYEKDIIIRSNLPQLLEKELPRLREKGFIGIGSGISDPYQPVEKEERIVRRSLQILIEYGFPVTIHTKSDLILTDLDLIRKLNSRNGIIVFISLTTLNENLISFFEPGAPSLETRINTIRILKQNSVPVGIMAMPFLPYLSDSREQISELFRFLKGLGVDFIMPWYLTLRPGKQKDLFLSVLADHDKELMNKYKILYSNELPSGIPVPEYRKSFKNMTNRLIRELGILTQPPHYLYRGLIPKYDEIFILLHHMTGLYKHSRVSRLKKGLQLYSSWLETEKKFYNRHRSRKFTEIESKLVHLLESGEMIDIIANEKLADLLKAVVCEDSTFDYSDLKLN